MFKNGIKGFNTDYLVLNIPFEKPDKYFRKKLLIAGSGGACNRLSHTLWIEMPITLYCKQKP